MDPKFLQFRYSPRAANDWHQLQDRFPRGRLSEFSQRVFICVRNQNRQDLEEGKLAVDGCRVSALPGYPTPAYMCCYDNNDQEVGFIFRISLTRRQFLVEEFYEGQNPPGEVSDRYAA